MKQITFCKITQVQLLFANNKKEFHEETNPVKAYNLTINTGSEERQVVSAITKFYKPEDLLNIITLFQVDLPPMMIRGVESQGMIYLIEENSAPLMLLGEEEDLGKTFDEIDFFKNKIIGTSLTIATSILNANNIGYRITRVDKNHYIITHDLKSERLNLEIDDDIVTRVSIG